MLLRERPLVPPSILPPPAPLPSLRDALQRRASIFGPVEDDMAPAASRGPWQTIGDAACRVIEKLTPGFRS